MSVGRTCLAVLLLVLVCPACRQTRPASPGPSVGAAAHPVVGALEGDAALPAIECPLRKAGVNPAHLRPFAEVEQYIQFLERPDRAAWQKPDAVVAALGLTGGETVVGLGAGSGYFAFRLAQVLPRGKVVAADAEAEMIRHIHPKAMTEKVRNIQPALIKPNDPQITSHT